MNLKHALLLAAITVAPVVADTKELIEQARTQLQAARSQGTEEAYLKTEETVDNAVKQDAKNPIALLMRGAVRMERAGWLAGKARFGPANEVMIIACADMDAAVAISPGNFEVRMTRGLMYGRFPTFLNKSLLAREDLELVLHSPDFAAQPAERRAMVQLVMGLVYGGAGDLAKAGVAFLGAVDADPNGEAAKEARAQMKKLAETAPAAGAKGPYHPDRFPKISADTSPVIAAASVTMPGRDSEQSPFIQDLVKSLKSQGGMLSSHVLRSVDHPGMLVIMTWWKDKQALNDWFYSDAHQGLMKQTYVDRKPTGAEGPSQIAIELLTTLPGGMRFNGGLAPEVK
ncbi:MAG TPA: antibiotic biosynthesis monooxygenase family protein [Bryobacteraceae bacterium]